MFSRFQKSLAKINIILHIFFCLEYVYAFILKKPHPLCHYETHALSCSQTFDTNHRPASSLRHLRRVQQGNTRKLYSHALDGGCHVGR